ncbi:hypothetical protein ACWGJT_07210 [Streptomyces xantholiticus]
MSDDEELLEELADVSPEGRAILASLALRRLSLFPMEGRFSDPLPSADAYFARALAFCDACVQKVPTDIDPAALRAEYEAIVMVNGEYVEEPEGPEAWSMDVLDIAEYAVGTWRDSHDNRQQCGMTLSAVDSFVDMLEETSPRLDGDASMLPDLEAQRRSADLTAVKGASSAGGVVPAVIEDLYAASLLLAQAYRERVLSLV